MFSALACLPFVGALDEFDVVSYQQGHKDPIIHAHRHMFLPSIPHSSHDPVSRRLGSEELAWIRGTVNGLSDQGLCAARGAVHQYAFARLRSELSGKVRELFMVNRCSHLAARSIYLEGTTHYGFEFLLHMTCKVGVISRCSNSW